MGSSVVFGISQDWDCFSYVANACGETIEYTARVSSLLTHIDARQPHILESCMESLSKGMSVVVCRTLVVIHNENKNGQVGGKMPGRDTKCCKYGLGNHTPRASRTIHLGLLNSVVPIVSENMSAAASHRSRTAIDCRSMFRNHNNCAMKKVLRLKDDQASFLHSFQEL